MPRFISGSCPSSSKLPGAGSAGAGRSTARVVWVQSGARGALNTAW